MNTGLNLQLSLGHRQTTATSQKPTDACLTNLPTVTPDCEMTWVPA